MLLINLVKCLKMLNTVALDNAKPPQQKKKRKTRLMNDSTTRLLIEEFQELRQNQIRNASGATNPYLMNDITCESAQNAGRQPSMPS